MTLDRTKNKKENKVELRHTYSSSSGCSIFITFTDLEERCCLKIFGREYTQRHYGQLVGCFESVTIKNERLDNECIEQ